MKKLALLVALVMVASCMTFTFAANAEGEYSQAPMFDALVESGELPPVEERLPENPCYTHEFLDEYLDSQVGNYGGTLRLVTSSVNWDADGFVAMTENLLTMQSSNSDQIDPNIVESYEVDEDQKVFTFHLRKGLKWSDGVDVTMEDFEFGINNFVFNAELTPVIAAWMRDAGTSAGDPFTFEVVDDQTFRITFKESYGGFVVHLSIAGWKGYTEFLKPAHVLKQYHIDFAEECHGSLEAYYEFIKPYAAAMGYDDPTAEGIWTYVFNQMDCTNWELTDPNDQMPSYYFGDICPIDNFPVLYPWVMKSCDSGVTTWERNPYFFCVDADGQQLPYFDYITSTYRESAELVQFSAMSGEVDFMRESATINNISLYRENEEAAGITAYTTSMHNNPADIQINFGYGLNPDGTVKEGENFAAWQEMVNDKRFLQALEHAVDAEEVVDGVFNGFAEPNEYFACDGDSDLANQLLDEMGAVDIDGDGFRETPSGLPFYFNVYMETGASHTDNIAASELYYEFWTNIGLNVTLQPTDSTLFATMRDANEVEIRIMWLHANALWHYAEWYTNEPLWQRWIDNGGLSGEVRDDATDYLEPSEEFKEFVRAIQGCFTVDPVTAVNVNVPALMEMQAENLWDIEPLQNVQQCVVINSDIQNVPSGGIGISWDFGLEEMFYAHPEEH